MRRAEFLEDCAGGCLLQDSAVDQERMPGVGIQEREQFRVVVGGDEGAAQLLQHHFEQTEFHGILVDDECGQHLASIVDWVPVDIERREAGGFKEGTDRDAPQLMEKGNQRGRQHGRVQYRGCTFLGPGYGGCASSLTEDDMKWRAPISQAQGPLCNQRTECAASLCGNYRVNGFIRAWRMSDTFDDLFRGGKAFYRNPGQGFKHS